MLSHYCAKVGVTTGLGNYMKYVVAGLVAVLFAGNAFAQSAPGQTAEAPQAETQPQAEQKPAGDVPTVPVQTKKSTNTASIVLGAVGAAALLGAASHGGGGSDHDDPGSQPGQPSSP